MVSPFTKPSGQYISFRIYVVIERTAFNPREKIKYLYLQIFLQRASCFNKNIVFLPGYKHSMGAIKKREKTYFCQYLWTEVPPPPSLVCGHAVFYAFPYCQSNIHLCTLYTKLSFDPQTLSNRALIYSI